MKIAFDVQPLIDNQKTGIGFCEAGVISHLCKESLAHSYLYNYFCLNEKSLAQSKLEPYTTPVVELNGCNWFSHRLYRALWNFIPLPYTLFFPDRDVDITQFFNFYIPPGVKGLAVSVVHDMCYKAVPQTVRLKTKIMLNLGLKRSCKRANKIITISEFSKNEIIKYLRIPAEKIAVIPLGVNCDFFKPHIQNDRTQHILKKYGIRGEFFLYLGTIEPRKNIELLIDSYRMLKKLHSDTPKLVISGRKGWLYKTIFEKVTLYELQDDVVFTGYIEDEDAPVLISCCVAFVFPSIYEGFGMPVLEAMACGVPVITSNAASLPEVAGDAALLINPYSVDDLCNAMLRILNDLTLRTELIDKGLRRVQEFSWEKTSTQYLRLYETLLQERGL